MDAQVKLLRVIENGEAQPIGARMPLQIDVRVIAATNRKLQEEVEAGRFREDLYYRLNVVQLTIPPLRQRNGDIPALSRHLRSEEHTSELQSLMRNSYAVFCLKKKKKEKKYQT